MDFLYEQYPIITIVPLLVMLVLVATTKKVFESLVVALVLVFVLKDGAGFVMGFMDSVYAVFAEGTYPWIVMMLALFGGLIALLIKSGGISAFRNFAQRYIRSERSALVFTWVLGMVLFIDDYINNLGIGPTVRGLTDRYRVPREQLGFSICCTGTPVCALVPLTAFAVFVFGVMKDYGISGEGSNMFSEYIKVIPFMFYPIIIILVSLLLAIGVLPRFGAFKTYYRELEAGADLPESVRAAADAEDGDLIDVDVPGAKLIDFVLPVLLLVVVMFANEEHDLVLAVLSALALAFVMYIFRKKMSVTVFFETFFEGVKDMIFILAVVLMTFVFVEGLNAVGFSDFVVTVVKPVLSGGAIPALTFLAVGIVAFLGVDYWAVMLLIAPIALPLADRFAVSPYMTMAAIVSGSVFGGTACFFAEQILMCSQAVQRPPVRVAVGGLPYSVLAACLTVALYLVFGFAL